MFSLLTRPKLDRHLQSQVKRPNLLQKKNSKGYQVQLKTPNPPWSQSVRIRPNNMIVHKAQLVLEVQIVLGAQFFNKT